MHPHLQAKLKPSQICLELAVLNRERLVDVLAALSSGTTDVIYRSTLCTHLDRALNKLTERKGRFLTRFFAPQFARFLSLFMWDEMKITWDECGWTGHFNNYP